MQQFDPNIPNLIGGNVTTVVVIDPASTFPGPEVGNHVLDGTKSFEIQIKWEITGGLAPLWLAALAPFGNWNVQVYAESIGGGPEILLTADNSVVPDPSVLNYEVKVTVPPNTLQEGDPGSNVSGIYKLVAAVFLNSNLPGAGFDMTGFNEGPIIQVENPV
jgi:hypothetical protein